MGLLPDQANMVKATEVASHFRLKFITTDQALRENHFADKVILVRKFISHSVQDRIVSKGVKTIIANGLADSVVTTLKGMVST